jgi:transposase
MMNKQPVKSYDAEFKQRAVKLAVESESQAQVARDLGISKNTLYSWIRQYQGGSSPAAQVNEEHLYEELKRLRQENKRLKEERDILKKATAYFVVNPL